MCSAATVTIRLSSFSITLGAATVPIRLSSIYNAAAAPIRLSSFSSVRN